MARLAICLSDNVRIKRSGPFIHLKTYAIDGELLRSGSAIFNASGAREQDNSLIVIRAQKPPGSRVLILRGERREKVLPFKFGAPRMAATMPHGDLPTRQFSAATLSLAKPF